MNATISAGLDPQAQSAQNPAPYSRVPFPIAIVGMAVKLPGGVGDTDSFWDMLINKRDGHCEVPITRYNVHAFYEPSAPAAMKTRHGYFLQDNIAHFDKSFFGMNHTDAERIDPQQRLLLEVAWECMENGGQRNWQGKNVGCFVGVFGEDWLEMSTKDVQNVDRFHAMNTGDFALANRLSYEYDLQGPSITYRTACSSSMVGLHEACQALYSGECDSAIVGGVNLILGPTMTSSMSEAMVLSPSGVTRAFDRDADGYGRGEAVNAIHIKPLAEAIRQGDPIRAVIRSTATNCDGKTPTIATPGPEAQERLIKRAYSKAGIDDLSETAFFECHGTGTVAGDTAETSVVARLFHNRGIYIGSVKPNIGHSEGASGLTSIIKAALTLEKRVIPPNIHFLKPNPKIPFEEGKLTVPVEPMSWPEGKAERVSVNCFGIGGTNVHVILESFPSSKPHFPDDSCFSVSLRLLVLSAKKKESLEKGAENIQHYLTQSPVDLDALAYTLGIRRDHMANRSFAIADTGGGVSTFEKAKTEPSKVAFIFSGQGAQWTGMGRELLERSPCFRASIRSMDQILKELENPPSWNLEDELLKEGDASRISQPEICQPICTAVQVALTDVLQTWGITPEAVVGHSSGEIAAAYASGAITARVAISLAYYRGQAIKASTIRRGGMAAVGMTPKQVQNYVGHGVTVACENSPESVTLSGDEEALVQTLENIKEKKPGTFCKRLDVSVAYHSNFMQEPSVIYKRSIAPIMSHNSSMVPLYSTVTGNSICDSSSLNADYWTQNLQSPVLFNGTIQHMIQEADKPWTFVEVGPHSTLSSPMRGILRMHDQSQKSKYIPTLIRNQPEQRALLMTAGRLFSSGHPVDLSKLNGKCGKLLTNLPSYPWLHEESLWSETRITRQWKSSQHAPHELLGSRCLESAEIEPSWRRILQLDHVPWLSDHSLGRDTIFPCAGYIAMAGEAIRQVTGSEQYTIRNLVMKMPLVLRDAEKVEILTSLRPLRLTNTADSSWFDITIMAYQNDSWKRHCVGQVKAGSSQHHSSRDEGHYPRSVSSKAWYGVFKKWGFGYGPEFQLLENIFASTTSNQAIGSVRPRGDLSKRYAIHPTIIDQNLQLLGIAGIRGIPRHLKTFQVPSLIEGIDVCPAAEADGVMSLYARCHVSDQSVTGDSSTIIGGKVVVSMTSATLVSIDNRFSNSNNPSLIARLVWKPHIDLNPLAPKMISEPLPGRVAGFLDQFTYALITNTAEKVRSLHPRSSHLKEYQAWLICQAETLPQLKSKYPGHGSLCQDNPLELLMEESELEISELQSLCLRAKAISELLVKIMDEVDIEESSDENDGLKLVSEFVFASSGWKDLLHTLGHSNPDLRVLITGARHELALTQVLINLTSEGGIPLYEKITISSSSAPPISNGKTQDGIATSIEYTVVDLSKPPAEQGLEDGEFDLVICCDTFDGEGDMYSVSKGLHDFLAPGGRILYQESWEKFLLAKFVMGISPVWWAQLSEDIKRVPLHSQDWETTVTDRRLQDYFEILSSCSPSPIKSTLMSRRPVISSERGHIALLYLSKLAPWAQYVRDLFIQTGYNVTWMKLGEQPPNGAGIISLIDLEGPYFHDMSQVSFLQLQILMTQTSIRRVLWVTESCQMSCKDPRFGLVLGFARSVRQEAMEEFATLEIDDFSSDNADSVLRTWQHMERQQNCSSLDPDREFAVSKKIIHVSRAHWRPAQEPIISAKRTGNSSTKALDIGTSGLLSSLSWRENPSQDLKPDEIEIDMKYCSLNFRDIMVAMGVVGDKSEFGLEGSGLVRRVGSLIKNFEVGQPVMLMMDGLLRTNAIVPARCCLPLPLDLSLADAATLPCVYSTVLYSLIKVARLEEGQTILIHSACGGVGIAAIQLCQMVGAKIFATVGSEEKAQYLVETFGIPRAHIFDSRSSYFLHGVMDQTNHRGVDVVLNSLAGELLHTSWRCVASFGKMLELGKRDILGNAQLDMSFFSGNRSFIGVDLKQLLVEDESELQSLLQETIKHVEQGTCRPIRPVTVFEAGDISKAFAYMQTGKHMGKVLVQFPEDPSSLPVTGQSSSFALASDVSYLLVGGLGGLGRTVATWMIEKGARKFVFLSRSVGKTQESLSFIQELESQDCSVTPISGRVDSMHDVQRAVAACKKRIGGVIQMSAVIESRMLSKLTYQEWRETLAPKVQGTWNLHNAISGRDVDFFVCFSSVAGLCGNTGQTHYAAANSFLDSFAQYRHEQGLAASVIDIGLVDDAGFAHENLPQLIQRAHAASLETVGESQVLQALERAISQTGQFAIGMGTTKALSDPGVIPQWGRDARYSLWKKIVLPEERSTSTLQGDVKDLIEDILRDPQTLQDPAIESRVTYVLGKEIASRLVDTKDMDNDEILGIVIESLTMIEIQSWLRRHLSLELALADISNASTIAGLGKPIVSALRAKYGVGNANTNSHEVSSIVNCEKDQHLQDMTLGREIRPLPGPVSKWDSPSEGHVILTGATGFIGAFFLSMLVDLPQIQTVTCLIRAANSQAAMARLNATFEKFHLSIDFQDKVKVVTGDLTKRNLGLGPSEFAHLSGKCSGVFHLGAAINYASSYSVHREANVLGLMEILRFANADRLKAVYHFSSISAYGPVGFLGKQTFIPEDQRPAAAPPGHPRQHTGYFLSKFVSESICWDAIANGFPITIYRPGFVLGHSVTGVGNPDDSVNRLMSTCIRLGAYPEQPNQPALYVPVDFVCSSALQIALSPDNLGRAYNLIRPNPDQNISLPSTFAILSQMTSPPLRCIPLPEWLELLTVRKSHSLSQLTPMIAARFSSSEALIWWDRKDDSMVAHGTENLRAALANRPDILQCKDMSTLLQLYYQHWSR
ncbi:hypothetical protein N7494_002563 [Penicillium frequentans]|uniref:Carrier domain-containing protein n=1 Tax=Penicillium frequentans TaxID=3151616 RepID=A0AAD6D426_9EURO|nr:hypothetical protein N7494_002563 [Penicillium glabrum]